MGDEKIICDCTLRNSYSSDMSDVNRFLFTSNSQANVRHHLELMQHKCMQLVTDEVAIKAHGIFLSSTLEKFV